MENTNSKVEVIVHINETMDEERRSDLTGALEKHTGIYTAEFCPLRYHLVLINYDRRQFSSQEVLKLIIGERLNAQLIGPI